MQCVDFMWVNLYVSVLNTSTFPHRYFIVPKEKICFHSLCMETLRSHFKNTHWHYHKYLCCSRICVRILVCHLMPLYTNESKVCYMLKEHPHHSAWGKITASETTSSTEQLHPPFLVPPSFCFTLISIYFTSVFKLYDHTYFLLPSFYYQSFRLLFIILFV